MLIPLSKPVFKSIITFSSTLAIGTVLFSHVLLQKINSITCNNAQTNSACSFEIQQSLQALVGERLFFTNIETSITATPLASTHYQLKSYSKEIFSGVLKVQIEPLKTMYAIENSDGTRSAVNEKGYILGTISSPNDDNICTIYQIFLTEQDVVSETNQNEPVKNQINQATHTHILEMLEELSLIKSSCLSLTIADQSTWLLSVSPNESYILDPSKLSESLSRLSVVQRSQELSKIEEDYAYIDLRFELPVLRNVL